MALRESEERLRAVIDSMVIGVITIDGRGVVQSFSPGAERMFGYAPDDVVGNNIRMLIPEPRHSEHDSYIANYINTGEAKIIGKGRVVEGRRKDGSTFPMELEVGDMVVGGRRLFSGIARDVTVRKRAEDALRESEARFRAVVDHSPAKIHIKDAQGRYTLINREAEKLYGVTAEEGRGKASHEIFSQELAESFDAHDRAVLETGRTVEVEEAWPREDGLHTYLTVRFPIRDAAGEIVAVGAIGTDITESKKAEERIRHLATHDVLTGLPNRALGMDRLSQALAMARRNVAMAALVFVDLDGFKGINDTHGHEAGDRVLREVAGRLSACVRETDTVARFGGDEFLVVLTAMTDKAAVTAVVEKVLGSLSRSFAVNGRVTPLGASIGVALYPGDGETPEELFRRADSAMYAAKAEGKNNYRFATREQATTAARG